MSPSLYYAILQIVNKQKNIKKERNLSTFSRPSFYTMNSKLNNVTRERINICKAPIAKDIYFQIYNSNVI